MRLRGTPGAVLLVTAAAGLLALGAVAAAFVLGVERIDLARALIDPGSADAVIFFRSRLPRVVLGLLVGAALAPSGIAFQALLRNPLADPYVLGVSGGAAVAGSLVLVLGIGAGTFGALSLPVWALGGALVSVWLVLALGRVRGRLVPNVALLAGVVLNALAGSLVVAIRLVSSPTAGHRALYWLTGTLSALEPAKLWSLGAYVLLGLVALFFLAVPMNALSLGEEAAHVVGVPIERARRLVFLSASLLTAAAVAFAGPIGFVGIVVPHLLRALIGPDHRLLLPAGALLGGAFVVLADTAARLGFLLLGTEPTCGVVTALLGAPFFLVVLRRRGSERIF